MMKTVCVSRAASVGAAFVFFSLPTFAAPIVVSGVAVLDAGPVAARELAIQDALSQAGLYRGATIQSVETVQEGLSHESGNVTALPLSGKVTVLNERAEGGLYHVKVKVDAAHKPSKAAAMGSTGMLQGRYSACQDADARALRRRLVTTYFAVPQPSDASDLVDLSTALPQELAARLSHNPLFKVVNASGVSMLPSTDTIDSVVGADQVRVLGRQQDAQFVVAGRIISTAVTGRFLRATLFESANTSQQGMYYNGPFSGLFGGAVKYVPTEREFGMEIWVYDALTGSVILTDRVSTTAQGAVVALSPLPFASAAFWATDYGRAIDRVLGEVVSRVGKTLACIPFSARVIEVEAASNRIYINAGGLDGLQVGDRLLWYKEQSPSGLRSVSSDPQLGVPETLAGDITILQVQPRMSMAIVRGSDRKVQAGDIVRYVSKR